MTCVCLWKPNAVSVPRNVSQGLGSIDQDWDFSVQTEQGRLSKFILLFSRYHNISMTAARSQNVFTHGDVHAANSLAVFQLYGFPTNPERNRTLLTTEFEVRFEFSMSWTEQSKRKVVIKSVKILFTVKWFSRAKNSGNTKSSSVHLLNEKLPTICQKPFNYGFQKTHCT